MCGNKEACLARMDQTIPRTFHHLFLNKGLVFLFHSFFFSLKKSTFLYSALGDDGHLWSNSDIKNFPLPFFDHGLEQLVIRGEWLFPWYWIKWDEMKWNMQLVRSWSCPWGVTAYLHQTPFVWFSLFPLTLFFFEKHKRFTLDSKTILLRKSQWRQSLFF